MRSAHRNTRGTYDVNRFMTLNARGISLASLRRAIAACAQSLITHQHRDGTTAVPTTKRTIFNKPDAELSNDKPVANIPSASGMSHVGKENSTTPYAAMPAMADTRNHAIISTHAWSSAWRQKMEQ